MAGWPAGAFRRFDLITPENVADLTVAWTRTVGEAGGLQTSPLVIDGVLVGFTPDLDVIALDGASGEELWRFAPPTAVAQPSRGLTYWADGDERRLFAGAGHGLYALDPATGALAPDFGDGGWVDLRTGLRRPDATLAVYMTSPGVIFDDLIITGFRTAEQNPAAPGAVRAYDVRTGELRWTFHTIPGPGEPGAESWPEGASGDTGGANPWAGMVVDEERGIVFAPTGSATSDFYGADRLGDNLYANTLLALDARTGERIWHFQAVHHDVNDYDFPSPPVLVTVTRDGATIDAVAQATKQGVLFIFDRETGEPVYEIEERPIPEHRPRQAKSRRRRSRSPSRRLLTPVNASPPTC